MSNRILEDIEATVQRLVEEEPHSPPNIHNQITLPDHSRSMEIIQECSNNCVPDRRSDFFQGTVQPLPVFRAAKRKRVVKNSEPISLAECEQKRNEMLEIEWTTAWLEAGLSRLGLAWLSGIS
jgi:hypothetical protein